MKVNKYKLIFGFIIAIFILGERCVFLFGWLDKLHVKHFLLMIALVIGVISLKRKKNDLKYTFELKTVFWASSILYAISLFYQIYNGSFKIYALEEYYYLIAPLFFVFIIYNISNDKKIESYMDIMLYVGLFCFFLTRIYRGTLNISNFMELFDLKNLFVESKSLLIESDLSVYFMVLTIYYTYKKKKLKAFLAALGTFIAYKRVAVLFLFLFFAIKRLLPKNKQVNNKIYWITNLIFIFAPFAMYYMCTDSFAIWFYEKFRIDFNKFTMTRFSIINTVIDADLINYGLGTITDFLERRNVIGQTNMHNDILRMYMECGLLGTICFTINYFKICRNNYYVFFIMFFVFVELFVAHFLGPGSISFWIIVYIAIFEINSISKNDSIEENIGEGVNIKYL